MFKKSHATVLAVGLAMMALACDPVPTSTDQSTVPAPSLDEQPDYDAAPEGSSALNGPPIQVIKLFDKNLFEFGGPVLPDPFVRKSTTADIVLGAQHIAILSSSPNGFGIPNVDDFITINGQFVQGGRYIPLAVSAATGTQITNPACVVGVSVNLCAFPRPHHHPVDVSDAIPVGNSTITVEIWDWGGGFGHTDLYLVIFPPAHS